MKKIAITSERNYEVEIGRDYLAVIDESHRESRKSSRHL